MIATPLLNSASLITALLLLFLHSTSAVGLFFSGNLSFTFHDEPISSAVPLNRSWICGSLHVADPIDACSPLQMSDNDNSHRSASRLSFVLISRGTCKFKEQVGNAQDAGFQAAIIYNNEISLFSAEDYSTDINMPAVYISKTAGETLKNFSVGEAGHCCLNSEYDDNEGSTFVMFVIFIEFLVSVMLFIFCKENIDGDQNRQTDVVNRQTVETLPCFVYKFNELNDKICSICLDEYKDGERLRILPCMHEYHAACVDPWLTKWGTFCPVCKHEITSS